VGLSTATGVVWGIDASGVGVGVTLRAGVSLGVEAGEGSGVGDSLGWGVGVSADVCDSTFRGRVFAAAATSTR